MDHIHFSIRSVKSPVRTRIAAQAGTSDIKSKAFKATKAAIKRDGNSQRHAAVEAYDYAVGNIKRRAEQGEVVLVETLNIPNWAPSARAFCEVMDLWEADDARMFLTGDIGLPLAASPDEQVGLARHAGNQLCLDAGGKLPIIIVIHHKPGNPHCHFLIHERPDDGRYRESGRDFFAGANKCLRTRYFHGRDFSDRAKPPKWLLKARADLARFQNEIMVPKGFAPVSPESLKAQGIDRAPQRHFSPRAAAIERKYGVKTKQGEKWRLRQLRIKIEGQFRAVKEAVPQVAAAMVQIARDAAAWSALLEAAEAAAAQAAVVRTKAAHDAAWADLMATAEAASASRVLARAKATREGAWAALIAAADMAATGVIIARKKQALQAAQDAVAAGRGTLQATAIESPLARQEAPAEIPAAIPQVQDAVARGRTTPAPPVRPSTWWTPRSIHDLSPTPPIESPLPDLYACRKALRGYWTFRDSQDLVNTHLLHIINTIEPWLDRVFNAAASGYQMDLTILNEAFQGHEILEYLAHKFDLSLTPSAIKRREMRPAVVARLTPLAYSPPEATEANTRHPQDAQAEAPVQEAQDLELNDYAPHM